MFEDEMKTLGLLPFHGEGWSSYQNKPLVEGGIRVEVVGDVASVWCPSKKINVLACSKGEALKLVQNNLDT